jgi:hypothetical protein
LKVVNDAKGGTVYRDHLPLLGEQGPGRSGLHGFAIGDQVVKKQFIANLECIYDTSFLALGQCRPRFGISSDITARSWWLD